MKKLPLSKEIMLSIPISKAIENAQSTLANYSQTKEGKEYHESAQTVADTIKLIRKLAQRVNDDDIQIFRNHEISQNILGPDLEEYIASRYQNNTNSGIIHIAIRLFAQDLLKNHLKPEQIQNTPDEQLIQISWDAAREIGPSLGLSNEKEITEIQKTLWYYITDPDGWHRY